MSFFFFSLGDVFFGAIQRLTCNCTPHPQEWDGFSRLFQYRVEWSSPRPRLVALI